MRPHIFSPISLLLFAAILTIHLTFLQSVRAQDTVTGAFEGTVTSADTGIPIAGAAVEIVNQQTGQVIPKTTDTKGRFYEGLLAPGIYTIRVSAQDFLPKEVQQRLFITRAGEVVPVPVALERAPIVATSSTISSPPSTTSTPITQPSVPTESDTDIRARVNTSDARQTGAFTEEEVATLPLGSNTITRTFDELTLLLPGVAPPPQTLGSVAGPGVGAGVGSSGQFAVNGLRSRANNFTVDGSDNNDEDIGVRRQGFVALNSQPIESIKEYQAITLLAPAQFGRNIGAQVNAVSKSGGQKTHGTLYGFFNSSQLNARNFFDTTFGNDSLPLRAGGKAVFLNGKPLLVNNQSGGKDSFTFGQGGFVLGGPLVPNEPIKPGKSLFYFISAEGEIIHATQEASFAVPTVEQRGFFNSGATGLQSNPFNGATIQGGAFPNTVSGDAVFSLFPFPNNPNGIYGPNTLTQTLPAGGEGKILSGKADGNFKIRQRQQSLTSRYNFTDDWRDIPITGGAIFSTLRPRVRTQNLSNFLNSEIVSPKTSTTEIFNQVRASYGRTQLRFAERRNTDFLRPSTLVGAEDQQFVLNARGLSNTTNAQSPGIVVYTTDPSRSTVEDFLGPVGQVIIAGFSPVGVDVFNFPQRRVNNTYQLADDLSIRTSHHIITSGIDLRRSELNSDLPRNARPLITFNGVPRLVTTARGGTELHGFYNPLDLVAASAPSGVLQAFTPGQDVAIGLRYYQYNYFTQDVWRVKRNLSLSYGLRYEYNTPPSELNKRIENTFNDPALNLVPGLRTFLSGRTSIFDPDRKDFAPRLGIAYATHLLGTERPTIMRAGYGIFYDQAIGAVVSQSRNVFPNFLTVNLAGGVSFTDPSSFNITDPSLPFFSCSNGNTTVTQLSLTQPGTLNNLNPFVSLSCLVAISNSFPGGFGFTLPARHFRMPMAQHYTFTIEQQISSNLVVEMAYVGTQGRHLIRLTTPNLGQNAFLVPNNLFFDGSQPNFDGFRLGPGQRISANNMVIGGRPVGQAGAINIYESSANSRYDSLQLQIRGRSRRGLQYQLAYTLSKVTDEVSDVFDLAGASALPQDSFNLAAERGPANFDSRHHLTYNFIYDVSAFRGGNRALRLLLGGLQISGLGRFQTGQPFTVNSIYDVNLDGNLTDRLNTTAGLIITGDRRQPIRLADVDPNTLLAPVGQNGRIGRNTFRAGNLLDLNLAVSKKFAFGTHQNLLVRTEIFNFINRANFGIPVRFLGAVGFGKAIETVTPGRRIQFALEYSF